MDTNETITSEELAAYMAGELDPEQAQRVERWAAQRIDNAEELRRLQETWTMVGSADAPSADTPDVDRAWDRLNARMNEAEGAVVRPLWSTWRTWLAAAAMLAMVFTAYRIWVNVPTVHVAQSTARTVLLEDGSSVVLSPGAQLSERMGQHRRVEMEGTVYFDVRHDAERPFEVQADDVVVTVLGTSFEVRSATDTSEFAVRVRTGRVRVKAGGAELVLEAGDRARYDKRSLLERTPAPPAEVWGERILQFSQAPLSRVVAELERMYQVHVVLANPSLERCQLTAEFDDEPIGSILQVIAETFALELKRTDSGDYELNGDGC